MKNSDEAYTIMIFRGATTNPMRLRLRKITILELTSNVRISTMNDINGIIHSGHKGIANDNSRRPILLEQPGHDIALCFELIRS